MLSTPTNFTPHAAITISDTTGPNPTIAGDRLGFTSVVASNGVGDVTLNMHYPIDMTNANYHAQCLGSIPRVAMVEPVVGSDTQIRVRLFDVVAGAFAAAEGGFCLEVSRKAIG